MTTWLPDTQYLLGNLVWVYSKPYICVQGHDSKVFGTDKIERGFWKNLHNEH